MRAPKRLLALRVAAASWTVALAALLASCSDDATTQGPGNSTTGVDVPGTLDQVSTEDGVTGADAAKEDSTAAGDSTTSIDAPSAPDGAAEVATEDAAPDQVAPDQTAVDGATGDDAADASPGETTDTSNPSDASKSCPGIPGCACTGPTDCDNGLCLEGPDGKTCASTCTTTCSGDQVCAAIPQSGGDVVYACVYKWGRICNPCKSDSECTSPGLSSAFCADQGAAGAFCSTDCTADADCPADYVCGDATSISGKKAKQCLRKPDADGTVPGTCPCSKAAVSAGSSTVCAIDIKDDAGKVTGTCKGLRVCKETGLTACESKGSGKEVCDGQDNDCNGLVDDGLCKGDNPCVVGTCVPDGKGGGACSSKDVDGPCDDGSACTLGDTCAAGVCKPGSGTKDCDDKNSCTVDTCDAKTGCLHKGDAGAPCDDGNACTLTDLCGGDNADTCAGKAKVCDDGLTCTADSCEAGKCVTKPLSDIACDDGNLCTEKDTCASGSCAGAPLICNDKDPCTSDACDAVGGKCIATPSSGAKCDDGSLCTVEDTCASGKCTGAAKTCTDGNGCFTSQCDTATGDCKTSKTYEGQPCDDSNVCTQGDTCVGNACMPGVAKVCDDSDPCTMDACSPKTGLCSYTTAAEGQGCDDGKPCTVKDACTAGKCAGVNKDCGDGSVCTADVCDAKTGQCSNDATGLAGKACPGIANGICQAGVCLSPSTGKSVAITAGYDHTCSIKADSTVQCWGANNVGQLGLGDVAVKTVPWVVPNLSSVVAIAAGGDHTCAIAGSDRNVVCWGASAVGQSGIKANVASPTKILIFGTGVPLTGAVSVATGTTHACASTDDRKVYCWGTNAEFELGQADSTIISETARPLPGLSDAIALSARANVTCALTQNGQARCWGNPGKDGSLGTLATYSAAVGSIKVPAPVPATGLTHVSSLSVGGLPGTAAYSHVCATKTDGSVWCFGANAAYQLGTGDTTYRAEAFKAASGLANMRIVVAGMDNNCGIDTTNQLWCWGNNLNGHTGQPGTQANIALPTKVAKATNIASVALGNTHGCVLRLDGEINCWGGTNAKYQLGVSGPPAGSGALQPISGGKPLANTGVPCVNDGQCTTDGAVCALPACVDGKCATKPAPDGGTCDDGNSCTLADACLSGKCSATAVACTDSNACTMDECATMVGKCIGTALPGGASCGDGAACFDGQCKVESKGWASKVSVGSNHACALRRDGTVWCWGTNKYGQLGNNTVLSSSVPVQAQGLSKVISVSAGGDYTCAVDAAGEAWCWGYNPHQNLGDSSTTNSLIPKKVSGLTVPMSSIVTSRNDAGHGKYTCGLGTNGVIYCWGYNTYGEAGVINGNVNVPTPTAVQYPRKVISLVGGLSTTCFYDEDGHGACFGYNDHGTVGSPKLGEMAGATDNTVSINYGNIFLPVVVQSVIGVRSIALGKGFGLAANMQGEVWGWGIQTKFAELTVAVSANNIVTPAPLAQLKLKDIAQVAAGGTFGTAMACVRAKTGVVQCWGDNSKGQVGANSPAAIISTPSTVQLPGVAIDVSVGENNACAVLQNGSIWCWGDNADGLVGNNVFGGIVKVATQVYGSGPLADGTAAGGSCDKAETCADDGNVCTVAVCKAGKCSHEAGANGLMCEDGDLCTPNDTCVAGACAAGAAANCDDKNPCTTDYCAPAKGTCVNAPIPGGSTCAADKVCAMGSCVADTTSVGYVQMASMTEATCALRKDGTVWCWGSNSTGQLGTSKVVVGGYALAAVKVELPVSNVVSVEAGGAHACAITSVGALYCWGANASGQIGKGSVSTAELPLKVGVVPNAKVVSAGGAHTCAVNVRGKLYCWGANSYGQIGVGKTATQLKQQEAPTQVNIGTSPVRDVSAGSSHVCAVTQDKSVYCWGYNVNNEAVPNNTADAIVSPTIVAIPKKTVVQVVAGSGMSCARTDDGTTYCWGYNVDGRLGDGTKATTNTGVTAPKTVAQSSPAANLFGGGSGTMCMTHVDGSLDCWGVSDKGQLGNGSTNVSSIPQPIDMPSAVRHLSFGLNHACAVTARGDMLCWGSSSSGKLGTGATWNNQLAIAQVVGIQPALFGAATDAPCKSDFDCRDDESVCTVVYCDTASKTCKHTAAPDGIGCGFSNACSAATTCKAGVCQLPAALLCNDNVACTNDVCAEATGQCLGMSLDPSCP